MNYNILSFCDIHSGVFDVELQFGNMEIINEFISQYNSVDLVVISGDYFDCKLPLNSKAAIYSIQWFHKFVNNCRSHNVKKVRIVKGTEEHDNDQLEVFRELEDDSGFFKIFNHNSVEETLPGLRCIYCPDENIPTNDYIIKYLDNIISGVHIGFFHGSFDVVLPYIVTQLSKESNIKNIIYEYNYWKKFIKGPLISGHWHDGSVYEHLIYIGSFDRWKFEEEESKGFGFIRYNTDTNEYLYNKIVNKFAPIYKTFTIYSNNYNTIEDYNNLISLVNSTLEKYREEKIKIRILIHINDDKSENESLILGLRQYYINNSLVKIVLKNKMKKEKKEEQIKRNIETRNKFGFILDKSKKESEIIQQFILVNKGKEINIGTIENVINKYLK